MVIPALAVALLVKSISLRLALVAFITRFCVRAELLTIPAPLTVNTLPGSAIAGLRVNALAPGLKTIPFNSVAPGILILVWLDCSNVAVSFGPFGTVAGVQFTAVLQSLLIGSKFQVALPARAQIGREPREPSRTAGSRGKSFTRRF